MKENRLFEIASYIDNDLIDEHVQRKIGYLEFNKNKRIATIRRVSVISACAAFVLVISLCFPLVSQLIGEWRGNNGIPIETTDTEGKQPQFSQTEAQTFPPDDSWPEFVLPEGYPDENFDNAMPYITVWKVVGPYYDVYGAGYLKLKFSKMISEELYYYDPYGHNEQGYYLVEYEVLKNYYETGEKNVLTAVFHVIDPELEEQTKEVLNFIKRTETCIVHNKTGIENSVYIDNSKYGKLLLYDVIHLYMYFDSIYPIIDDRIILNELENLYIKHTRKYVNHNFYKITDPRYIFVENGMPLRIFESNIRIYRDWSKKYYLRELKNFGG